MDEIQMIDRKKLLFVYNPISGTRIISRNLSQIVDIFTKYGYDVTCHPTQQRNDCMETVIRCHDKYDLIVISGGDGTLNEAVNGFMKCGYRNRFGYLPSGSTNDFSHSIGMPAQTADAARAIMEGTPISCDLGNLNGRFFTYVAGFGTLAEVSYSTPQNLKNTLGFTAYLLNGISALSSIESYNIQYETPEKSDSGEYLLGLVTNSLYVGGFKNILVNDVSLNDGLFEILLVRKPKTAADMYAVASSLLKHDFNNRFIECFKSKSIRITCDKPISWTLDGESGGSYELSIIENHRGAMNIIGGSEQTAQPQRPAAV